MSEVEAVTIKPVVPAEPEVANSPVPAATESENVHDSEEYESAEEIDEGEHYEEDGEGEVEEIEIEVEEEEEEEEGEGEDEEDEEEDEVEEGPGREKPLDDDQDRKNPQFIPKKGYFYEHDDRMNAEEGEEEEGETKIEEKPRKVSNVTTDRWAHDMFDENDQAPKTQDELSTRYGYDIRSDDMAPRAARRRKYGRGPSTYTRKWEEAEAYQKPRGNPRGRGFRGRPNFRDSRAGESGGYDQDFPELGNRQRGGTQARRASTDGEENKPPRPSQQRTQPKNKNPEANINNKVTQEENRDRGENNRDRGDRENNRDRGERENNRDRGNNRRGRGEGRIASRRPDWDMRDDRADDGGGYRDRRDDGGFRDRGQSRGFRGGRGRGGYRSEFRNRNIYPDRRGSGQLESADPEDENTAWERKVEEIRRIDSAEQQRKGTSGPSKNAPNIKNTEFSPPVSQLQASKSQPSDKKGYPFSNTEYTGNSSQTSQRHQPQAGTSNRSNDEREGRNQKTFENEPENVNQKQNSDYSRDRGQADRRPLQQQSYTNDKQQPRQQQNPPRLQQQESQHKVQQAPVETAKPKRFSTQRQRQDPAGIVAAVPAVSGSSQLQMGPGGSGPAGPAPGQMVATAIPVSVMSGYPPPQGYYEQVPTGYEAQVYEGAGSPIPIAVSGTGHGPSVSPSMWGPAGYSAAPYASAPSGPQIPPAPYGDPTFMAATQPQPIFAPPPYPHPQFIQDPTIINYPPPGPPSFGPPFHAQAFQGYTQMTPGPPELYHSGGVTYYSTQNQMQRPHIMVPTSKPPKSADSTKRDMRTSLRQHQNESEGFHQYRDEQGQREADPQLVIEVSAAETESYSAPELRRDADQDEIGQRFEDALVLQPKTDQVRRSPSPAPIEITQSWSDQMAELTPVNSPLQAESPYDLTSDKSNPSGVPSQGK